MPFDANGNFSLVPGTIVSDGMTIQPSQHNPPFQDVAAGLSMAVVRDGRAPMTGPLNMNSNKITNVADGTSDADVATVGQSALRIGDFKDTVRALGLEWLRRDGSVYNSATYPELSTMFSPLPEGFLWETQSPASTIPGITQMASSPGSIVLIVQNQPVAYVTIDGETWATKTIGFQAKTVAWGAGRFVILGDNKKSAISMNDGETWTIEDNTLDPVVTGSVRYSNGLFAASSVDVLAENPRSKIFTSMDGIVWTARRTAPDLRTYHVLVGGNEGFVARDSDAFYTSADGISWTQVTADRSLSDLRSGYHLVSGRTIFVGIGGLIVTTENFSTTVVRSSGTIADLNDVSRVGEFVLIVGGGGIGRISSDNGESFLSTTTGQTASLTSIAPFMEESGRAAVSGNVALSYVIQTTSSQFRVPDDNPEYGWIKAL